MRKLLLVIAFILLSSFAYFASQQIAHKQAFIDVCQMVYDRHFELNERLEDWFAACVKRAQETSVIISRPQLVETMRKQLFTMGTSHLDVYAPTDEARTWRGEDLDNGLRTRGIDGQFIVYETVENSPSQKENIKAGDIVLRINNKVPRSPWDNQKAEGWFEFQRGSKRIKAYLKPDVLHIDGLPELRTLKEAAKGKKKVQLLRISSFRQEYFSKENWIEMSKGLRNAQNVVVDLRGNLGGNFVSMLRALSTFFCQRTIVGSVTQPRKSMVKTTEFEDLLAEDEQLKQLEKFSEIQLKTFLGYPCYDGTVTVIVDSETSSVSEIFASAMQSRPKTQVIGQGTAGDVVLAVWYALPQLGEGYSVSIPEAVFMNNRGQRLEGVGLMPDRFLSYRYDDAVRGIDTLIADALKQK